MMPSRGAKLRANWVTSSSDITVARASSGASIPAVDIGKTASFETWVAGSSAISGWSNLAMAKRATAAAAARAIPTGQRLAVEAGSWTGSS